MIECMKGRLGCHLQVGTTWESSAETVSLILHWTYSGKQVQEPKHNLILQVQAKD